MTVVTGLVHFFQAGSWPVYVHEYNHTLSSTSHFPIETILFRSLNGS